MNSGGQGVRGGTGEEGPEQEGGEPERKSATTKAKAAKPAKEKKAKATKSQPSDGREGSKKAVILELLHRKEGATLKEIAKATGWQNHSSHGFLAGQLRKRMGLTDESEKNAEGKRAYRIA
jgi:hypothetical protein